MSLIDPSAVKHPFNSLIGGHKSESTSSSATGGIMACGNDSSNVHPKKHIEVGNYLNGTAQPPANC